MVRYTLFILAVAGSAVTAFAAIQPAASIETGASNVTVIEKNQFWPLQGDLVVEACAMEDCSDTPQG
jgi:hypothetical protein